MEKLNPVRRQFPCNKSAQENEKQNNYTSVVIFWGENYFLGKRTHFSLYFFPFQYYNMESRCNDVYMSPNKCTYARGKHLL